MKLKSILMAVLTFVLACSLVVLGKAQLKASASELVDITSNITVTGWDVTGNARELTYTRLSLGDGVLPADIGYGIIDNEGYKYIQEYITINGKTVKEINEQTDVSSYAFSTFPSSKDDKYKIPVIIYFNNDKLEIKIHNDYIKSLGASVVIGVKAGLQVENGSVIYKVTSDVTKTVWEEKVMQEVDITSNITVTGWDVTGNARELTYTRLSLGDGVLPVGVGYGIIDNEGYKYIQEYITVNGRTVKEINGQTDVSSYAFSTFPSSADDKYKVPVIIYFNNDKLEIKIHNDYIKSLGASVVIGVKAGLQVENGSVIYKVTSEVTKTVWEEAVIEEVDIVEKVSVSLWITQSEYQVTYLNLGENVIPTGVDYGVSIGSHAYVQDFIFINGRSIKEINADDTLGASDWEYTIFPTTADSRYKLPIILFAKTDSIEIKVHSSLIALLGEGLEITLKSDFYMENGNYKFVVSKEVEYALYGKTWADKNKKNKITYYLNGKQYGEVEEVLHNSQLLLREDPEVPSGYFFSGWEYPPTNGVISDMEIQGYLRPIEYSVTYNLNGGVNNPQNPIFYCVTDGEVVLKPATKDGAIFVGWYTSSDYTTKVERLTPSDLCDLVLYARFEKDSKAKRGCKSSMFGGGALTLVLCLGVVAFRLKKKD